MQCSSRSGDSLRRCVVAFDGRFFSALLGMALAAPAQAAGDDAPVAADPQRVIELTRPSSMIEIGLGGFLRSTNGSGNPDRYYQPGSFGIGAFDLRGDQYSFGNDSDDRTRWRLSASNLGLHSRGLSGEYGQQGAYRITFGFDEQMRLQSDSYETPLLGAGSASLTLPAGFVRGADTGAMGTLATSMRRFDLHTVRQRSEVGLSYWLDPEWVLRFSLRNEARDGSKIRGAEFGSNGGNARAMLLPEPIDSATQLMDASIAFNGDGHHFTLAYHGSFFRNRIASLTWQNPYSNTPWVGGATGLPANFPLDNGRIGVAPDNEFHQLALTGAYDFSSTTRLSMTATRGRMTQNDAFLPYTITPGLTSTALPRSSLNGLVNTSFFNARLSMRPVRNLSLAASLRYENRDSKTPQSEYIYVGGDIQLQPQPASNSDRIRTNLPRSRRQEQLSLDADYRIASALSLKAGWDRDNVKRSFAEVESATENTYRVELRQSGAGPWTANLGLARQERRGTQYLYNLPYLASYSSAAFINALLAANGCLDVASCVRLGPLQNKFYLADRDRERTRLGVGYNPESAFSLQARLDLNRDRYPNSPYGVTDASSWAAGADLGYVFSDDINGTLFYGFEDQRTRERSRQIASPNPAVVTTSASDWENRFANKTQSIGVGLRCKCLLGGRLELDFDAVAVRGRTPVSTTVGPAVTAAWNPATPFPDLVSRTDTVTLAARYALDRHSALRVNYFYRRVSSQDWAYQQVGAATITSLIGTNEVPARYAVRGVGVSYVVTFR